MANNVTVREIARAAEVSIGTVSRVLNEQANVAKETRQHVLRVARGLGYQQAVPPARATTVIREIGFVFNPVNQGTVAAANPYWSRILAGSEQAAARHNVRLTYRSLRTLGVEVRAGVAQMEVDAVLLVGPVDPWVIAEVRAARLPCMLVDHYQPASDVPAIMFDVFSGGRVATQHLIARGHRQIAFIGGPRLGNDDPFATIYTVELRAHGYRAALLDAGIAIDTRLVEPSNLTPEGGYQACVRLLEGGIPFTALFCANDSAAVGALKALNEAGRQVPAQVSVIGFGDYLDVAEQLTPALTTIRTDLDAAGRLAVQRLVIDAQFDDLPPTLTLLPVHLIERGSVRSLQTP